MADKPQQYLVVEVRESGAVKVLPCKELQQMLDTVLQCEASSTVLTVQGRLVPLTLAPPSLVAQAEDGTPVHRPVTYTLPHNLGLPQLLLPEHEEGSDDDDAAGSA